MRATAHSGCASPKCPYSSSHENSAEPRPVLNAASASAYSGGARSSFTCAPSESQGAARGRFEHAARFAPMPCWRGSTVGVLELRRTPIRAPNANAYAERWVGTLRPKCLDRILIINRRHLEQVLCVSTHPLQPTQAAPFALASTARPTPGRAPPRTRESTPTSMKSPAASSTNTKQPHNHDHHP